MLDRQLNKVRRFASVRLLYNNCSLLKSAIHHKQLPFFVLDKMSERQEPNQLPEESRAQFAERLWQVIMCIQERNWPSSPESDHYRMVQFVIMVLLFLRCKHALLAYQVLHGKADILSQS